MEPRRRMGIAVFVAACMALATTAGAFATGTQEPKGTAAPAKLVVWMAAYIQTAVDLLRTNAAERFPGSQIEITPYPMGEYDVKMSAALAANADTPDVMISHHQFIPKLIAAGMLDLTDRIQPIKGEFIPSSLGPVTDSKGRIYGLPFEITHTAFFYRQDFYANLGIKPPATLDDLGQVAGKLKGQGKFVTPGNLLNGDIETFEDLLLIYGGNYFDAAGNVILGEPKGKGLEAAVAFRRLVSGGVIWDGEWNSPGWFDALSKGDVGSILFLSWYPKRMRVTIKDASVGSFGQWRLAPPPVAAANTPKLALYNNVSAMINKRSKNVDLAWKFVQLVAMDTKTSTKIMNDFAILSGHTANLKQVAQKSDPWPLFGDQQIAAMEANMVLSAQHYHQGAPAYNEARKIMTVELVDLAAGKKSPEDAIASAVQKIRAAMQRM